MSTSSKNSAMKNNIITPISRIKILWMNVLRKSSSPHKTTSHTPSLSKIPSPSDLTRDIKKVFRYIDSNDDGKISADELKKCVEKAGARRLSVEEASAAVECSDSDGDGLLSLEDFELLMKGSELSDEEKILELREAFAFYIDSNKGVITPKSLKKMLSRLGEFRSIMDCKVMIQVYDLDRNGVLSFKEFVAMMA